MIANPRQTLGHWLKAASVADQVHCILRYTDTLLVAYCGCSIPLKNATLLVMGARHCTECERLHRQREQDRKKSNRHENRVVQV